MSDAVWGHDDLQRDLAATRRDVGEIAVERLGTGPMGGRAQIDVYALKPSWTNPNPAAYEVKVTRPDFLRDVQAGKYRKYLPFCRRLYFATPTGLVAKEEVPAGMGLCVRGANGWHTVRAPTVQAEVEEWPAILFATLLKVHPGPWDPPTRAERIRAYEQAAEGRRHGRGVAERVNKALADAERAVRAEERARAQLCQALGVDPAADERDLYGLTRAVLSMAPTKPGPQLEKVAAALRAMRNHLDRCQGILEATP